MCMDIAETYDDKCRAEKTHLGDRVEFNEQLQTYCKSKELTFVDFLKEV